MPGSVKLFETSAAVLAAAADGGGCKGVHGGGGGGGEGGGRALKNESKLHFLQDACKIVTFLMIIPVHMSHRDRGSLQPETRKWFKNPKPVDHHRRRESEDENTPGPE